MPTKSAGVAGGRNPLDLLGAMLAGEVDPAFSKRITGDEVEFHDGTKIILPRDMTFGKAYKILKRLEEEAEMPTEFTKSFRFRADDGAHAAFQCIKEKWGMLLGKPVQTFFGTIWPESRTINIGVNKTLQVPWGNIEIPSLAGLMMNLGETVDRDYGRIFNISATGPRKYKEEVEEFFVLVQQYLEDHSIYRGQALIGADNLEFLDLSKFRADQIVFATDVHAVLEGTVHAPIRYSDAMREDGVPLKRAVLLEGPYGTGKTSEGQIVAQIATENKWTFISARPGRDKVEDVLRTARLYEPAVVFIEDIDGSSSSGEDADVTKLLDSFDGIAAKGGELMMIMTTNHVEKIHKGMLRPGRLDAVVKIAELDAGGIERLIKVVVPKDKLSDEVDYKKVGEAMKDFLPAFVKETINRVQTFAINRSKGSTNYLVTTDDLVSAALSLRPQLDLQDSAGEGTRKTPLDVAFGDAVVAASERTKVFDPARGNLEMPVLEEAPEPLV